MHHSHETSVRRRHHVNHLVRLRQRLLQHNHRERRRSCADVTRTLFHGIRGHHTRTGVTLRRTYGHSGLQRSAHVQLLHTGFRQFSGILTGTQRLRQDVQQLVGQTLGCKDGVELLHHLRVVRLRGGVNGNHARCVAHAQHELTRQLPVDISCQRGQIFDVLHVRLVVKYALIQVRDAPAQGDVIVEQLRQFCRCLARVRVTPRAERHQNLLVGIECHVAMHHSRETDTCQLFYLAVIL